MSLRQRLHRALDAMLDGATTFSSTWVLLVLLAISAQLAVEGAGRRVRRWRLGFVRWAMR